MSISFYPYVRSDDGWDFPARVRETKATTAEFVPAFDTPEYMAWYDGDLDTTNSSYDRRLDINMAEDRAAFVLNELGLHNGDIYNSEPLTLDAFEAGLLATIARNPDPVPGLPSYESKPGDPGCKIIHQGTPDGYANMRFDQLVEFVKAAREYGATHIGWG